MGHVYTYVYIIPQKKKALERFSRLVSCALAKTPCFSLQILSEKKGHISDKNRLLMAMQSIDNKLLSRVYGAGKGSVFTQGVFLDLGSRAAVDKALSRLAQKGTLRRLARGLYDNPKTHPDLGVLA